MTMPDIDLDAIEARIAAAPTNAEWRVYQHTGDGFYSWCVGVYDAHDGWIYDVARCDYQSDADLIAHAPIDLTALVAENKRLRAVAEAARVLIPAGDGDSLTEYAIAWANLRDALDAWRAGGGA